MGRPAGATPAFRADLARSARLLRAFRTEQADPSGYYTALATLGYEMSARYFQKRYGFHEVRGTTMEVKRGVLTGRKLKIFEEHEKALFLKRLATAHHLPLTQTVAVGDSRSDREVFKVAGFRIALNQDGFLRKIADVDLKGRDLRVILKHL